MKMRIYMNEQEITALLEKGGRAGYFSVLTADMFKLMHNMSEKGQYFDVDIRDYKCSSADVSNRVSMFTQVTSIRFTVQKRSKYIYRVWFVGKDRPKVYGR